MSALIEAARAALEALEAVDDDVHAPTSFPATVHGAMCALRTALAAAEAQPAERAPLGLKTHCPYCEMGFTLVDKAQPVGEPFGYVITNNVPESSPYRNVFYRPSEISAAYKDNAMYSTPVYAAPPAQPAAQPLTDAQIEALVLETVYENDERIPYRDYWVREIGMPFARAIERAHGIWSQP